MKKQLMTATIVALGFGLLGCQKPAGQWSLASVDPTAARRDVPYHSLTLLEDGTFYAEAMEGGRMQSVSGTYHMDNGTLILTEHDGEIHGFDAQFREGGRELHLASFEDGQKIKAKYEKRERVRALPD